MGGGESLVTSAGKAVDFRCIIIHVINVGRSHFSNNCHVITVMQCRYYIAGSTPSYLYIILLLVFEVSAIVLSSMTHFVHVNSELQRMVSKSVPHPTTANFDLGLSGLVPLLHIQKLFFANL